MTTFPYRSIASKLKIAITICLCLPLARTQTQSVKKDSVACLSNLRLPDYPRVAAAARLDGEIEVRVDLDAKSAIKKIALVPTVARKQAGILLSQSVESALRNSTFSKSCAGTQIQLVFSFVLDLGAPTTGFRQASWFRSPNRFVVSVTPQIVQQ